MAHPEDIVRAVKIFEEKQDAESLAKALNAVKGEKVAFVEDWKTVEIETGGDEFNVGDTIWYSFSTVRCDLDGDICRASYLLLVPFTSLVEYAAEKEPDKVYFYTVVDDVECDCTPISEKAKRCYCNIYLDRKKLRKCSGGTGPACDYLRDPDGFEKAIEDWLGDVWNVSVSVKDRFVRVGFDVSGVFSDAEYEVEQVLNWIDVEAVPYNVEEEYLESNIEEYEKDLESEFKSRDLDVSVGCTYHEGEYHRYDISYYVTCEIIPEDFNSVSERLRYYLTVYEVI